MANEIASTVVQLGWVPEGPVSYELMSLSNEVRFDSSGSPSRASVGVTAYRLNGTSRSPLAVNSAAGAQHWVVLKVTASDGSASATASASIPNAASLRTVRSARFDLIPKTKTPGNYTDADVLATCPVLITADGQIGGFTSIAFIRCAENPGTPSGGTYDSPVPTNTVGTQGLRWSDAPPAGSDPLWMSRAYFTQGSTSAPSWSPASPVSDSVGLEYIWCPDEEFSAPSDDHPYTDGAAGWRKDSADAVWMAAAVKNNGVWSDWDIVRVKGEAGRNAVFARVTPATVEMKKGTLTYKAFVDVYDGDAIAPWDEVAYPTLSDNSGRWLIQNVVKWDYAVEDGRFCYVFTYFPTAEVVRDVAIEVTYKGRKYPVVIPLRSVADGQNGTDGTNGVYVPPPMLWSDYGDGYTFQAGDAANGDTRLDMVLVRGASDALFMYSCRETHVKGANPSPELDTYDRTSKPGGKWLRADIANYRFLATDLLWANVGRIDFLSGQAFRVGEGTDICGYFGTPIEGSGAILYSGGDTVSQATFVVYKDGRVVAKKADIEGALTAATLDLKVSSAGSGVPDGSLCYDTSAVRLPELGEGRVRMLRILNPVISRSNPENLLLIPATASVGVYAGLRFDHGSSETLTLSQCGRNGGVYIELMGYYDPVARFTHWGVVRNDQIT